MLAVVHDQQEFLRAQVVAKNLEQRQGGALAQAEHGGYLRRRQRRIGDPAQIDEPNSVPIALREAHGKLERQPRLPDAAEAV
jgi:hypothetical protein